MEYIAGRMHCASIGCSNNNVKQGIESINPCDDLKERRSEERMKQRRALGENNSGVEIYQFEPLTSLHLG